MKVIVLTFKILITYSVMLALTVSCSYEKTSFDFGSLFEPTWDFSKKAEVSFDENFVEIKSGQIQLKPLDLTHEGEDFNSGNHIGTHYFHNSVLLTSDIDTADLKYILPNMNSNLVAYWKFDEKTNNIAPGGTDYEDFSGRGAHANEDSDNLIFTSGRIDSSIYFDGINTGAQAPYSSDYSFDIDDNYAVSLWVKLPNQQLDLAATQNPIIENAGTGAPYSIVFRVRNSNHSSPGTILFARYNGTSAKSAISSSVLNDNRWHHIVGQVKNGISEIYIDGVLEGSSTENLTGTTLNLNPFLFGHSNRRLTGSIDEVGIYNTFLSADSIQSIYKSQSQIFSQDTSLNPNWTPMWDNIVGYWKMDGNWQDSSGNGNHGTPSGSPSFITENHQIGLSSGSFTSTDHVQVIDDPSLDLGTNLSFSGWVKFTSFTNLYAIHLLIKQANISNSNFNLYFFGNNLGSNPENEGRLQFFGNRGGGWGPLSEHHFASLNQWIHIGFVYDTLLGGQLFINGAPIGSRAGAGNLATNSDSLCIGQSCDTAYTINHEFDDFALWNVSLTTENIKTIYNRQKQKYAGHYDSEVIDLGRTTSTWPDLSWSTNLPFGKELVGDFDNDGNPDSERADDYFEQLEGLNNELIGYWPFNEIQRDTYSLLTDFKDLSGNNIFLEESGGITLNHQGKFLKAIFFDGIDDYINAGDRDEIDEASALSSCLWVKHETENSDHAMLSTTNGSPAGFLFFRDDNSGGDNNFYSIYVSDGVTSVRAQTSTESAKAGRWNHVCFTYLFNTLDGLVIYLNGNRISSGSTLGMGSIDSGTENLIIGSSAFFSRYLHGYMDELAIWARRLSDSEIQQLYRRGANRIKFQVKSCIDSSCECKSFSESPTGSSTDCDGDTIVNTLDFDDPHKAKFIGPGGDGSTYYSEAFSRKGTDMTFNCGNNTTDSYGNICVSDEITFSGGTKPTSPVIDYSDLPLAARPNPNPYFQYRVYMEADDNTACSGSPCLPQLSSVGLNSSEQNKYYGRLHEVVPTEPLAFTSIESIKVNADECVTFQLSPDGINYYYVSEGAWVSASAEDHRSTQQELEENIVKFSNDHGPGLLHIKAFLQTNSNQNSSCSLRNIDVVSENK